MVIFSLTRVHENEALLVFIIFQKKHRVESLSVARDKYKRLERRLNKIFALIIIILVTPSIIIFFGIIITRTSSLLFFQMSELYLFGLTVFILTIYNGSTLGLVYQMYCDHRMAFYGHIKSHLVLFFATELTLIGYAATQAWLFMINTCFLNNEELVDDIKNPAGICW